MINPKNSLFWLLFLLSFVAGILFGLKKIALPQNPRVILNGKEIQVEIADSSEDISQGLSGRASLPSNTGMLFVFSKPGSYQFRMKDMNFDLDFVFINGQTIVELVENVPYPKEGEEPKIINAKSSFDKVLEINAGKIKETGLKLGDKIELSY